MYIIQNTRDEYIYNIHWDEDKTSSRNIMLIAILDITEVVANSMTSIWRKKIFKTDIIMRAFGRSQ